MSDENLKGATSPAAQPDNFGKYTSSEEVVDAEKLPNNHTVDESKAFEDTSETHFRKQGWWRGGAGSSFDAWLTTAAAQIGQVMLAMPHAVALVGMRAAIPLIIVYSLCSMFTIHLLATLYLDYRRRMVTRGTWAGGHHKRATQYFEVLGELTGSKLVGWFVLAIVAISLLCTTIAQIVAIATGMYYLAEGESKRTWALVWGGILTVTMSMVPTFRHFRLLNIISLTGTFYTAVYLISQAGSTHLPNAHQAFYQGPTKMQNLFLGANIFMSGFGGHSLAFETIDAMYRPHRYDTVYPFSYLFTYFVTVPHSFLIQLAYPTANEKQGNVYGAVPVNGWRDASIVLMIIHQCVAYALYVTPVFFMWEKLIRTHHKPLWIRLPSRLPVALFVWFIALLFPFFDIINAVQGSVGYSFTAFVFPAGAYLWVYGRSSAARANAPKVPRFVGGWAPALALCLFIFVWFLVFGVGFGTWASLKQLIDAVNNLGVFAACYQCAGIQATNKANHG
ncbi:hypothetical protein WJX73_001881 [Symbiochloris irregularis]|uniref:Amino acid transporter transmembrane domain-containing protein n=1 Tax=Symbiochloris irregularis TaxID=706552 RepID=A0AAW1NUF2_9CHLO